MGFATRTFAIFQELAVVHASALLEAAGLLKPPSAEGRPHVFSATGEPG